MSNRISFKNLSKPRARNRRPYSITSVHVMRGREREHSSVPPRTPHKVILYWCGISMMGLGRVGMMLMIIDQRLIDDVIPFSISCVEPPRHQALPPLVRKWDSSD